MKVKYMKRALELARKGEGRVNPNPLVGAVIVKDGRIIGEGYHGQTGKDHAEIEALKACQTDPAGGEIYVNLEPCSHYGRTPPCTRAIIESGIRKVYIANLDPNPLVASRGVQALEEAGIQVKTGILEEEATRLNEVFFKYIVEKKPFLLMKFAMSMDGKIATSSGESKWITGPESRQDVHKLRNKYRGIMVGVNTVIKDDPSLTCRMDGGRNPIRIVLDNSLRTPLDSKILQDQDQARTIIFTSSQRDREKEKKIREMGVQLEVLDQGVDLKEVILILGKMGIDSILLEGGGSVNFSALEAGLVDKVKLYMSPKFIGGREAKTPVEGEGIQRLSQAFNFDFQDIRSYGEDLLIISYPERRD